MTQLTPLRKVIPDGLVPNLLLALVLVILLTLLRTFVPQESLKAKAASRQPTEKAQRKAAQLPAVVRTGASIPAPASDTGSRGPLPVSRPLVTAHDTINGDRISDPALIERIERIAATVPQHLLTGNPRAMHIRYLAQGFGPGDDAPISYGIFREPAVALAFGCALDADLADRCVLTPVSAASEDNGAPPGVHCVPMRLAFGAPAYEPDRCEANG